MLWYMETRMCVFVWLKWDCSVRMTAGEGHSLLWGRPTHDLSIFILLPLGWPSSKCVFTHALNFIWCHVSGLCALGHVSSGSCLGMFWFHCSGAHIQLEQDIRWHSKQSCNKLYFSCIIALIALQIIPVTLIMYL